ncbi:hypothetical protein SAMN02745823_02822 [Sporobacter termitidis DSM 10068]|uniref:Bacteriophage holin of superfamily 6 (Holin_LLH) n=1 Tax=Sporobacter termitidis DSM 10068 TaxID=1123282 RepID=A0A1M5YU32_9FIRM|nr:hypothetical protein [Sporobacter termitidis]SHI15103.1 hypothetical protein SAMN02745823_02822 [Sporobacter termitidis DSM 10068]
MNWTTIIIVGAVIVFLVLVYLARRFGIIPEIGLAGKLLSLVEDLLVAAGWVKADSNFDKIARTIINGILLMYTSGSSGSPADKVTAAMNYISATVQTEGITLTGAQLDLIKGILMGGFNFLTTKRVGKQTALRMIRNDIKQSK